MRCASTRKKSVRRSARRRSARRRSARRSTRKRSTRRKSTRRRSTRRKSTRKRQGYKDRKDESIAMRRRRSRTKRQLRASANESYGRWGSKAVKSGKINRRRSNKIYTTGKRGNKYIKSPVYYELDGATGSWYDYFTGSSDTERQRERRAGEVIGQQCFNDLKKARMERDRAVEYYYRLKDNTEKLLNKSRQCDINLAKCNYKNTKDKKYMRNTASYYGLL